MHVEISCEPISLFTLKYPVSPFSLFCVICSFESIKDRQCNETFVNPPEVLIILGCNWFQHRGTKLCGLVCTCNASLHFLSTSIQMDIEACHVFLNSMARLLLQTFLLHWAASSIGLVANVERCLTLLVSYLHSKKHCFVANKDFLRITAKVCQAI